MLERRSRAAHGCAQTRELCCRWVGGVGRHCPTIDRAAVAQALGFDSASRNSPGCGERPGLLHRVRERRVARHDASVATGQRTSFFYAQTNSDSSN
jgi:hypothetical protein